VRKKRKGANEMKYFLMILLVLGVVASKPADHSIDSVVEVVKSSILALHTAHGPAKSYIVWHECGKRLNSEKANLRAEKYAATILASIEDVERRTGEVIDPNHVVAILFRESSNNECVIGHKETKRLGKQLGRKPGKREIVKHVRNWLDIYSAAKKKCGFDKGCLGRYIYKNGPDYLGIKGWDLGIAQYRWPGSMLRRRSMTLPGGRVITRVALEDLFDHEVSIQLLVEDLAYYKQVCSKHTHWSFSKWGHRVRKLDTEEAYYVHHHSGEGKWSEKYWKAINRHLRVMGTKSSSLMVSLNGDISGRL
jgi:hypothetical protein